MLWSRITITKAREMLKEMVSAGNPQFFHDGRIGLAEVGIDEHQSHRWQREADISEEDFEA